MRAIIVLCLLSLVGCVGLPEGVKPVDNFELQRYLGKWYEIARFDHRFERGMSHVTAEYSLRDDGGVSVLNRGFRDVEKTWNEAEGRAYFAERSDQGYLKVSFFRPFYGSYVVFELDLDGYQYALICGPDRSYLWILARSSQIEPELRAALVAKAAALGFDTSKLIYVDHQSAVDPSGIVDGNPP